MKAISFFRNRVVVKVLLNCISAAVLCQCYSFTGGTAPSHIKTVQIMTVTDESGFGIQQLREEFTQKLYENFRNDNSLSIIPQKADSKLTTTIVSIIDGTVNVRPGEIERERRVTVTVKSEFYDNIKKKSIFSKNFSNAQIYSALEGQLGRNSSALKALNQIADDVVLAAISGW